MVTLPRSTQGGFTLLEAIVALTILAGGATALYAWVNTNLITLQRVDAVSRTAHLVRSAAEYVAAIDPLRQPEGQESLGDATLYWRIGPAEYQAPAIGDEGYLSINDVSLMRAEVRIVREQLPVAEFSMWVLGVREARSLQDVLFN